MALKLRRNLVDFIREFFAVTYGVVGFKGVSDLCHLCSPLKIKVHKRANAGIEIAGLAQLLGPQLLLTG